MYGQVKSAAVCATVLVVELPVRGLACVRPVHARVTPVVLSAAERQRINIARCGEVLTSRTVKLSPARSRLLRVHVPAGVLRLRALGL